MAARTPKDKTEAVEPIEVAVVVKPPAQKRKVSPRKTPRRTPTAPEDRKKAGRPKGPAKPKDKVPLGSHNKSLGPIVKPSVAAPAAPELREQLGLNTREALFIEHYLLHYNATRAYEEAGYAASTPQSRAVNSSKLMKVPRIAEYLRLRTKAMIDRVEQEQDKLMRVMSETAYADPNDLVSHHIDCCRFCYGEGNGYQFTPQEWKRTQDQHKADTAEAKAAKVALPPKLDPQGGVGFNPNNPPHDDCPECFGRGHETIVFKDTRYLSPAALSLYAGAKEGKSGKEIFMHSQGKAREVLAKIHKLHDDNTNVNVSFDAESLEERFGAKMKKARDRMEEMRRDRAGEE